MKRILLILFAIVALIAVIGFAYLEYSTYEPVGVEDAIKRATDEKDYYYFRHDDARANVVFYPGGLVEPEAYAIFAAELSEIGVNVYVMRMPFNLAILKSDAAEILEGTNDLPFVLAGHSLGGASLSIFLESNEGFADFLILLASYPAASADLSDHELAVLSLYGTEDGVLDMKALKETEDLLPNDTTYYEISGGNHAYFANYGKQRGDGSATITPKQQRETTISRIEEFLAVLN
ncbi:MAG: alpha/beta hydrolase [Acholeplasmataceae bacterium]